MIFCSIKKRATFGYFLTTNLVIKLQPFIDESLFAKFSSNFLIYLYENKNKADSEVGYTNILFSKQIIFLALRKIVLCLHSFFTFFYFSLSNLVETRWVSLRFCGCVRFSFNISSAIDICSRTNRRK